MKRPLRIAMLSPLPPEQSGIADYAANFVAALENLDVEIVKPFQAELSAQGDKDYLAQLQKIDWSQIDLAHAELGGGRLREYHSLQWLQNTRPALPLTATIHDPERLIWRPSRLPGLLDYARHLPRAAYQATVLLADPLTLRQERKLAQHASRLITLTHTGASRLQCRMQLPAERISVIPHGNLVIPTAPLVPLSPLKLLYFGFIYRGKGLEDLIDALALVVRQSPQLRPHLQLTLAGGTAPEMTFGSDDNYLNELKSRIASCGISDLITFQTDILASAIPTLIQAHHVMVLPYRESKKLSWLGQMRGTSGALSWAAACGRGAITSDARAFPEEVAQGNGSVFLQGDVAALARIFQQLAEQPAQVAEWAKAAALVGQARQWPHIAQQFKNVFTEITTAKIQVRHAA